MLYANGIGPINIKSNEKRVRDIANQVDLITLREEASLKELQRLKVDKPPILVTADPALTLKPVSDVRVDEILKDEGIRFHNPIVGISVRSWEQQSKYSEVIARVADYIYDIYHAEVLFIPMHFPHDLKVIKDIASKMKHKPHILQKKYSVPEILGVIKNTDLLIGMRLHALIYAATLSVPVIGLAYEAKVEGFLNYIGQVSAGDIANIDFETLCKIIDDIWPNRDSIRKQLETVIGQLKEKALENARLAVQLLDEN
jgi:polysaccharide pyruvyl transferase WcaK-like protein